MKKSNFSRKFFSIGLSLAMLAGIIPMGVSATAVSEYNGVSLTDNDSVSATTIWNDTDVVYNETVLFYEGRETAKLLYPIDTVISVRSYDLQTVYTEGVDYRVTDDGWLQWISGGNMPKYEEDFSALDIFTGSPDYGIVNGLPKPMYDNQVCVTYTHSAVWENGFSGEKPEAKLNTQSVFYNKLVNGSDPLNVVFFGDSITVGYNASGLNQETREWKNSAFTTGTATMKRGSSAIWYGLDYDPTQEWTCETWAKQIYSYLDNMSNTTLNYHNVAIAGKASGWGKSDILNQLRNPENTEEYIAPDVIFVGFGMNDTVTKATYKSNIESIISSVKTLNSDCLIVLVSAFDPNYSHTALKLYEEANEEIEAKDSNVISAPVYSVFYDVKKSKLAADYTSNGFNHPNDFGVRLYAKIIEATLSPVVYTAGKVEVTNTWNNDLGSVNSGLITWNNSSLIAGQYPTIHHVSADVGDSTSRPWSPNGSHLGMTDGNINSGCGAWYQFSIGNNSFGATTAEPTGTYPWCFAFDMGANYDISKTAMVNHLSNSFSRLYKYGFYVADTKAELLAKMRAGTDAVYKVTNGNSAPYHYYSANDDAVTGRYVGIAVTDLNEVANGTSGANLMNTLEFAVFGTTATDIPVEPTPETKEFKTTLASSLDAAFGTEATANTSVSWSRNSIIAGVIPTATTYYDGTVSAEALKYQFYVTGSDPIQNGSAKGMTDGSTKPGASDYGWFQVAISDPAGKDTYYATKNEPVTPWYFTFELDGKYAIDSAALLTHATNQDNILNNYKIYISDNLSTLYDGEPVAIVECTEKTGFHHFSIDKEEAFVGRYIGLEVLDFNRCTTSGVPGVLTIREFGVFGEKLEDGNVDLTASELISTENGTIMTLKHDSSNYAFLNKDYKYIVKVDYAVKNDTASNIALAYNNSSDVYNAKTYDNGSTVLADKSHTEAGVYTISAIATDIDKYPLRLIMDDVDNFEIRSVSIKRDSVLNKDTVAVKIFDEVYGTDVAEFVQNGTALENPERTDTLNFAGWYDQEGTKVTSISGNATITAKWCSKYDLNRDESIDVIDLVRLKKNVNDTNVYYDINRDDLVNAADLVSLRRYLLGFPKDNYIEYNISVDTENVVNGDFEGIGVNSIPVTLMSNNIAKGSKEAFWELEKSRILNLKPATVRLWTQVDWFVTDNDLTNGTGADYLSGKYDFESESMQALYAYLDAYKQAGSKIVLVTNWKVGSAIQGWFSIEGIEAPENSAPKNINAYANAYAALLEYLINTKGYTNIEYVSVANEPELNDFESNSIDNDYTYYVNTAKALYSAVNAKALDVKLLGFDGASDATKSLLFGNSLLTANLGEFDLYGIHTYENYTKANSNLTTFMNMLPSGKSLWLTEFNGSKNFDVSPSGQMNLAANLGYKSALYWMLNDIYGEDPLDTESESIGSASGLWNKPYKNATVKNNYYELGLWMRYVKPGSDVLSSTVDSDKIRSTVFKNGEDYTVIVENDTLSAESVTINFGKNINKTFYKHIYSYGSIPSLAQGTIPASVESFDVTDTLKDVAIANGTRTVTVYTTIPDVTQVTLAKVVVNPVKVGESYQLSATATNGADITWSVVSGNGTVDSTGKYTATGTATGDRVAVKAEAATGEYAIAVIYIAE